MCTPRYTFHCFQTLTVNDIESSERIDAISKHFPLWLHCQSRAVYPPIGKHRRKIGFYCHDV